MALPSHTAYMRAMNKIIHKGDGKDSDISDKPPILSSSAFLAISIGPRSNRSVSRASETRLERPKGKWLVEPACHILESQTMTQADQKLLHGAVGGKRGHLVPWHTGSRQKHPSSAMHYS